MMYPLLHQRKLAHVLRPDIEFFLREEYVMPSDSLTMLQELERRYASFEQASQLAEPLSIAVKQYGGSPYWLELAADSTALFEMFVCVQAIREATGGGHALFGLHVLPADNGILSLHFDVSGVRSYPAIIAHYLHESSEVKAAILRRKEMWARMQGHFVDMAWPNGFEFNQT